MLLDLEQNGMDAVRKYSQQFDGWAPDSFELSEAQVCSLKPLALEEELIAIIQKYQLSKAIGRKLCVQCCFLPIVVRLHPFTIKV